MSEKSNTIVLGPFELVNGAREPGELRKPKDRQWMKPPGAISGSRAVF